MNSHVYTAASGMMLEQRRLELIANNLANLSTNGYRPTRLFVRALETAAGASGSPRPAAPNLNAAVRVGGTWEAPGASPLLRTGRALDVAVEEGTYLVLDTPGGTRYTRAGGLQIDGEGRLTDAGGHPVLDERGRPLEGLGVRAEITGDGRVLEGEDEIGRLQIVRDPRGVLRREGEGRLTADGRDRRLDEVDEPSLRPGWLESSGTDVMDELVRLVQAQRAFETYQRLVSLSMNDVNRKAVNDIAG